MALPPGPPLPPFLATTMLMASPHRTLKQLHARYGDIFTLRSVAFGTEVLVTQPATIRQVLTGDSDTYSAAEANAALGQVLGPRSLLLLDGPPHLRLRKVLLPPFHGDQLGPLTSTIRDAALRAFASVRTGEILNVGPLLQRITLDIILRAVLGLHDDEHAAPLRDALTRLVNKAQSPLGLLWMSPRVQRWKPPFPTPWGRVAELSAQVDALLVQHVRARRSLSADARPNDLLDLLLDARDETGATLDEHELRDQLVTVLVAGHETTATSLAWAFEEILHHPGEAAQLADEVHRVTGGASLNPGHLAGLTRLDAVIKEVLRLYPVTGGVGRTIKRPVTLQGYELPPGVMAVPNFYLLHRRPDLYPNPDAFVPDRFIGKKIDPYAWMPFGAGAHRCLGIHLALYEMKVVLATLLSHHVFTAVRPTSRVGLRSFVLAPRGGTLVQVVRSRS